MKLGNQDIVKGQPVFYLDTAKTSTIEGAATTVYAEGGRGNTRLIAWEGEKTLTFTVEDALLSPISFAMLSGAGLVKGNENEEVHFHQTSNLIASSTDGSIDLSNALEPKETVDIDAPLFILEVDESGDLTGKIVSGYYTLDDTKTKLVLKNVTKDSKPLFDTVDQTSSKWSKTVVIETDTSNENVDWRYAQPLTSNQVLRYEKPLKSTYYASNYLLNTTTGALTAASSAKKQVSYQSLLNTKAGSEEAPIAPVLSSVIDALYTLSDNVSVIPYNLSHLQFNTINYPNKTTGDINYPCPQVTIKVDNTTKSPIFSEEPNELLESTNGILSCISVDAITALVKYLVYGKLAGSQDTNALTVDEQGYMEKFLKVQSALQYYYYSYCNEYVDIPAEDTHNSLFSTLNSLVPFYGFDAKSVFVADETTEADDAQAYQKNSSTGKYEKLINGTNVKNAAYAGLGYRTFELLKTGSINTEAFKATAGKAVMVDYYVVKPADTVSELQIDAANFAGYYYVEADTLFRRQFDGVDLPANITFPNVKIQSNFTFSMAPTGDPSTFSFTMDAMPGYTYFDKTKKVLCAIQIVDDKSKKAKEPKSIFTHPAGFGQIDVSVKDSIPDRYSE